MRKFYILLLLGITFTAGSLYGQAMLPDFTITNTKTGVILLWRNQYPGQVKGITVQRSYDSSKNFASIATVFNPQNTINGFADIKPPYPKMYYRLFIGFDTGVYVITGSKKPRSDNSVDYSALITEINTLYEKNGQEQEAKLNAKKKAAAEPVAKDHDKEIIKKEKPVTGKVFKPVSKAIDTAIVNDFITYPSKRIYTDKDNNIVINLPEAGKNKYLIKFFTEEYKPLFEIKNLTEDHLSIEKVNFNHAGWYMFEINKNGLLLEENKFFIPKD